MPQQRIHPRVLVILRQVPAVIGQQHGFGAGIHFAAAPRCAHGLQRRGRLQRQLRDRVLRPREVALRRVLVEEGDQTIGGHTFNAQAVLGVALQFVGVGKPGVGQQEGSVIVEAVVLACRQLLPQAHRLRHPPGLARDEIGARLVPIGRAVSRILRLCGKRQGCGGQ